MPLTALVPHSSRITQTIIHGSNENHTSAVVGSRATLTGFFGIVAAESSRVRRAGDVHTTFGRQILRKPMRQAMEMSEAPISTIHGLMKFEIRNCGMAKETPVTKIAGHTSFMPRYPANAQINQNGTISEKNGNCRPTIAPKRKGSRPVTLARPAIGVPSAPYATGAVLAISERPDAASGENPRPIKIAPVRRLASRSPTPPRRTRRTRTQLAVTEG